MGFTYLDGQNWSDITREERYFCAELYNAIKGNETKFVKWLITLDTMNKVNLNSDQDWEIAFEVSFYSDLFNASPNWKSATEAEFSDHRTFDLCLFSESQIVIIEAKAYSGFQKGQLEEIKKDKQNVSKAINKAWNKDTEIDVFVVALVSSKKLEKVPSEFDGRFSWMDIYISFSSKKAFNNADNIHETQQSEPE